MCFLIVSEVLVGGPGFGGVLHGLLSAGVVAFCGVGCLVGVVHLVGSLGLVGVVLGVLGRLWGWGSCVGVTWV